MDDTIRYKEVNMVGLAFGIGFVMMNVVAVAFIAVGFEFVSCLLSKHWEV